MIKNIIFDWSGTLSNDLVPVYTAVRRVFEILGMKRLTLEEYKREYVLPYMDFYHKFDPSAEKAVVDQIFLEEIHKVDPPRPFPGALETVRRLHKQGKRLFVLSSHPQKKLDLELVEYGMAEYVSMVAGSAHDKICAIAEMTQRNGIDPSRTAYVGDTLYDMDAGKAAGVRTIFVSWGYHPKGKLSEIKPDYVCDSFRQLERIIKNS
jgi:HAD superfamily hydrolase (TIGR01509 family)